MADSPTLPPLAQSPNPGLVGYVAAWLLPQADLLLDPVLASPGLVATDLALAAGAAWLPLPYTPNTLKLEETPVAGEPGTFQVRVTAQRPQPSPDVLTALAALDRRPVLLLLQEASGGRRLLGSTEEYLLLSTTGEAQNPASKAGVELRFEGQTTRRAPYYVGGVPTTATGGSDPVVVPPVAGTGGYVRIQDKHGNTMAVVAAGKTVTVTSSFRVKLAVK